MLNILGKRAEGQYGFRPTPDVRTFGEVVGHVGNVVSANCGSLEGEPNPNKGRTAKKAAAEEIASGLRAAFAYCDSVVAVLTEET